MRVVLSQKAETVIQKSVGTVDVIAFYDGQPAKASAEQTNEEGFIDLGRTSVELRGSGSASFRRLVLTKAQLESISTPDYRVLINVVGQKGQEPLNILKCKDFQDRIGNLVGRSQTVACTLLDEWNPPTNKREPNPGPLR